MSTRECTNCGYPIGIRASHVSEPCCVIIQWTADGSHVSPPIGPLSQKEANELATKVRKGLRKNKKPWQGRVHVRRMADPDTALAWDSIS